MKPQTTNPAVPPTRCTHRTPSGRQCRLPVSDARSGLCPRHRAEQQQIETADYYGHLTRNYHDFQTAQGINHSLHNLYELLAQNRISARRAAVLSYISSLLLRTLPQIDTDNAAGIKFPPKNLQVTHPDLAPAPQASLGPNPGSTSAANSGSDANAQVNSGPSSSWDPSNPEPDPQKKPS